MAGREVALGGDAQRPLAEVDRTKGEAKTALESIRAIICTDDNAGRRADAALDAVRAAVDELAERIGLEE